MKNCFIVIFVLLIALSAMGCSESDSESDSTGVCVLGTRYNTGINPCQDNVTEEDCQNWRDSSYSSEYNYTFVEGKTCADFGI